MYFLEYRFNSSASKGDYDYWYLGDEKPDHEDSLESWGEDLASSILWSGEGGDPADVRIEYNVVQKVPDWWVQKKIKYTEMSIESSVEFLKKLREL